MTQKRKIKVLVGTGIGNALEWFDWNVYVTFSAYFATQIFNDQDSSSALLYTLAVFAVGFAARPVGGVLFGWISDRIGRKHSLTLAVAGISVGSLLIAFCPTYSQVGWWSSLILLTARIIQGLADGGEIPTAQTYLAEHAPADRRGLWASSIYVTGTLGLMLGIGLGLVLETTLSAAQMSSWGWRIPFVLGAIMGLFAWWMRSGLDETEAFVAQEKTQKAKPEKRENLYLSILKNWRTALRVIGMTCGGTVIYYVWNVAMPTLAQSEFGYDPAQAFACTLIGNVIFLFALVFWGWLSDIVGRKPLLLLSMVGSALCYFPLVWWIQNAQSSFALIGAVSLQLVLLAATSGHSPATYAEMFPTSQRTSGFGIPYAATIALFGGTAAMVMTWIGDPIRFGFYSVPLTLVSIITVIFMPETKGRDLHD